MAFEDLKVRLAMIIEQVIHQPEDAHELQETVREELEELRATGAALPQDLVDLERQLEEALNIPEGE